MRATLSWNVWFLQWLSLKAVLTVKQQTSKERWRLAMNDAVTFAEDGCTTWWFVGKGWKNDWIVCELPSPLDGSVQVPSGHSYIVHLSLSWKGVSVLSRHLIVDSFGPDVTGNQFCVSEHP